MTRRNSGRRGHGEGAVYRRKSDGKWVGVVDAGFVDGKRQRRVLYGESEREVIGKVNGARRELDDGLSLNGRQQTVSDYVNRWLEQRDPRTPVAGVRKLRYTTWQGYEARMRRHALPHLGTLQLGKVRPDHIRAMLTAVSESVGQTTVAMVRDTLATILGRAVKDRVLPYNPVHAVDSVARTQPRAYVLTADQASALLRAAEGNALEALFVVTLHAGLRESEALGLQWSDLDLDRAQLTVSRALARVKGAGLQTFDPKTPASAATIPLTARAVMALRAHRDRVVESGRLPVGFVFSTSKGTPLSASNMLRRSFYPLCAKAGIPTRRQDDGTLGCRFHDLRHACGSLLIQQGVRPKDVQMILRHSKLSTTMDLYVHSYDADLRDAVGRLGAATI